MALTMAAINPYPYSRYSGQTCYYEVSNSSYSEKDAAYNTLAFIQSQHLSQKMQQLDMCKQQANERLFKKTGKKLAAKQAQCIDAIILCDYTKKPRVSFYEDKIKVQLDSGKNQYILDFIVNDFDGTVLVGSYKNAEYTVEQVPVSYLQNVIRG